MPVKLLDTREHGDGLTIASAVASCRLVWICRRRMAENVAEAASDMEATTGKLLFPDTIIKVSALKVRENRQLSTCKLGEDKRA